MVCTDSSDKATIRCFPTIIPCTTIVAAALSATNHARLLFGDDCLNNSGWGLELKELIDLPDTKTRPPNNCRGALRGL